jgi:hypothetical protein
LKGADCQAVTEQIKSGVEIDGDLALHLNKAESFQKHALWVAASAATLRRLKGKSFSP